MGKVAVLKGGKRTPFATRGCPWSTCGRGSRAEDLPEDPLRHAGMPLRYLWAGWPCRCIGWSIENGPRAVSHVTHEGEKMERNEILKMPQGIF